MALSKQDQDFYEEKLNFKSIGYLFGATTILGAIMCPLLLYIQDWSVGQTGTWSMDMVYKLAVIGFLLGSIVAVVMYLAFKCLLQMGLAAFEAEALIVFGAGTVLQAIE